MLVISNREGLLKTAKQFLERKKKEYALKIVMVCQYIHNESVKRTPMQTGETIMNYQWSINSPATTFIESPIPPRSGTNKLKVGEEPKRRQAEQVAQGSLKKITPEAVFGKMVYFTNNDPTWGGLEKGIYPQGRDFTPRSPQGMVRITVEGARARLSSGGFKVTMK